MRKPLTTAVIAAAAFATLSPAPGFAQDDDRDRIETRDDDDDDRYDRRSRRDRDDDDDDFPWGLLGLLGLGGLAGLMPLAKRRGPHVDVDNRRDHSGPMGGHGPIDGPPPTDRRPPF